jgi:formylglycine-generating enzyme required for sulfatase activity
LTGVVIFDTYCVIDLSAGANAASYPVTYLSDVPAGGWRDEYKTTKLVLRRIEPGSFKMNGTYDVTLTKVFYCGVFEVTQKQYELVTGSKPSKRSGNTLPVEQVSWNMIRGDSATHNWPTVKTVDSNSFVGCLQARTGLSLDIPTEAQWEYACRAGTTTTYYWGDSMDGAYAWYSSNASSTTHVVGTRTPNDWGLYDMSGNAWEWCLDWRGDLVSAENPEGASSGTARVLRGGSWYDNASSLTSSWRSSWISPSTGKENSGFRLVGNLSE